MYYTKFSRKTFPFVASRAGQCYNGDGQDQYKEIQHSDRFIYFNHIHDGKFRHKQTATHPVNIREELDSQSSVHIKNVTLSF